MVRHAGPGLCIAVVVVAKAAVMTVVAALLDIGFARSLILVVASALASGAFGLVIALIQIRENRRLHTRLDELQKPVADIAKHTATDRRDTDPPAEEVA